MTRGEGSKGHNHSEEGGDDGEGAKLQLREVLLSWLRAEAGQEGGEGVDDAIADYLVGVLMEEDLSPEEAVEVLGSYVPQEMETSKLQGLREELQRVQNKQQEEATRRRQPKVAAGAGGGGGGSRRKGEHVHNNAEELKDQADEGLVKDEQEEAALWFLLELVPSFPRDLAKYLWAHKCHGDRTLAAQVLVENCSEEGIRDLWQEKDEWERERLERAKEEDGLTEAMRARICERYADEVVVGQGEPKAKSRPLLPITNSSNREKKQAGGRREVRFRNGMVVSTKGEKYVVEKDDDWDGGSRGKVITRRGKGFR